MPPLETLLAALAACAAIGWVSGFLGIGGGFLLIPLLHQVALASGLAGDLALKQAMGTTLLVSSLTALSGWLVHRRRSGVPAASAVPLAAGVAAGALAGARVAADLLGPELAPLFGGALLLSAAGVALRRERGKDDPFPQGPWLAAVGLPVGFAAALVGLGGAVFTGLIFSGLLGYPVRRVTTVTSLAQVCGAALGTVGFAFPAAGASAGGAPGSVGYVCVPAALVALAAAWPAARLGARATHRTAPRLLRLVFALLLVALGLRYLLAATG